MKNELINNLKRLVQEEEKFMENSEKIKKKDFKEFKEIHSANNPRKSNPFKSTSPNKRN